MTEHVERDRSNLMHRAEVTVGKQSSSGAPSITSLVRSLRECKCENNKLHQKLVLKEIEAWLEELEMRGVELDNALASGDESRLISEVARMLSSLDVALGEAISSQ